MSGGAIPLEATRLGCQAIANDYNPVAYLILRATCEFPRKYGRRLVRDVEHWAMWILERVRQRVGHLYPPGKDGQPVVGYLWARTAPCSNPACRAEIPLLRSLLVCDKPDKRVALTMIILPAEHAEHAKGEEKICVIPRVLRATLNSVSHRRILRAKI